MIKLLKYILGLFSLGKFVDDIYGTDMEEKD